MQKQTRGEDKRTDKKRQDVMRQDEKQQEKINQEQMMQELVKDMKGMEWREDEDHNTMAAITNRTDDYSDIIERASAVYQAALNQPYA